MRCISIRSSGLETPRSPVKLTLSATRAAVASGAVALVAAATVLTGPASLAAAPAHPTTVKPIPAVSGHIASAALVAPESTSDCVASLGIHCYSPLQYRIAYNLNPLYAKGI